MVDSAQINQLMSRMTGLLNARHITEAIAVCRNITQLVPDSAAAFANLSNLLLQDCDADGAIEAARHAVALDPAFYGAHVRLAAAAEESGDVESSVRHFARAIELSPQQTRIHSYKLYAMEFLPGVSRGDLLQEQREWNRVHGRHDILCEAHRSLKHSGTSGKIKVGYLSAFFYHHAEAFFVLPLLESHDREAFEVHCYSDVASADEITLRHRKSADFWHDCRALSNDQLAEKIHQDGIDILVDLMMHMGFNRAQVLAKKPAPIQIAWLAYPGGTGMEAMDYRMTDAIIDPPGTDAFYAEKSLRLLHCWCCYDPLCDIPPVPPRPDREITFGSLNNPRKLNEPIIRIWARAMQSVRNARIIILSISQSQRNNILRIFESMGVSSSRVEFAGRAERRYYLRQYDRIDIALDPLPYNGITTTCDALWMGVPIVTLTGETAAGRAGASIVRAAGLPELIADSDQGFVDLAAQLAGDVARLRGYHAGLRDKVRASALMDRRRFAAEMETAFRSVWGDWCAGSVK
jgi:protein O-GlcNAc transferase